MSNMSPPPPDDIKTMLASRGERAAGLALDLVLVFVTFGIGWMVWSLIVWKDGLTPGKQILKMRVIRLKAREQASWGWMALRQAGIGIGLGIADAIAGGFGLILLGFLVTTVVMILTSDLNQTLSDRIVGTVVIKQGR